MPPVKGPATAEFESSAHMSTSGTHEQLLDLPKRVTVPPVDHAVSEELIEQITSQLDPLGSAYHHWIDPVNPT